MQAPKLIILGRDGVLNRYREDHVKEPSEWEPVDGALDAISRLNHAGWHTVVCTNQSGIGRGMIDMASLNTIHQRMMELMVEAGGRIDAVFFCPHAAEEHCECRKPAPGMMLQVADRYGLNLADVPLVSDNLRDMQAAQAAGCQPHLVLTGRAAKLDVAQVDALKAQVRNLHVHTNLQAFADALLVQGGAVAAQP